MATTGYKRVVHIGECKNNMLLKMEKIAESIDIDPEDLFDEYMHAEELIKRGGETTNFDCIAEDGDITISKAQFMDMNHRLRAYENINNIIEIAEKSTNLHYIKGLLQAMRIMTKEFV